MDAIVHVGPADVDRIDHGVCELFLLGQLGLGCLLESEGLLFAVAELLLLYQPHTRATYEGGAAYPGLRVVGVRRT